ncbi:MAG: DUF488 family protein [Gemmataceae bacterium]
MPIRIKRWNDPRETEDGTRILVCRYRPRALKKADETWDVWMKELGPTKELHADLYGKNGPPIAWDAFRERYLREMSNQTERIAELTKRVSEGETITLLCSSSCTDPDRCHRSLLKKLIESSTASGRC